MSGAGQPPLFFAVTDQFRGPARGQGAGRADPALVVAVLGEVARFSTTHTITGLL